MGKTGQLPERWEEKGGYRGAGCDGCLVSLVLLVLAPACCCWEMPELSPEAVAQLQKLV